MSKRASLTTMKLATAAKSHGAVESEAAKKDTMTTAIVLPVRTWEMMRSVALKRAAAGGRLSVSAVIAALAERHRAELEREIREG
jgi:hypothetical protein